MKRSPTSVYLDHNATSPVRPEVVRAMTRALREIWGNPSSVHGVGADARAAVEHARAQVAEALGVHPMTLVFLSGATEANHAVLQTAAERASGEADTMVTTATEHASVLETCDRLRERGIRIRHLRVDGDGRLDPERFEAALSPEVLLASVLWVNNETGVVQPIEDLARRARARGVPLHTDAVQALGKLPVSLAATDVAFASFSAHKLGGPKGIGALYVAPGQHLRPWLRGGGQERGLRAGTENVPGIVGFGVACEVAQTESHETAQLRQLRDRLWDGIAKRIPDARRNGAPDLCAPHVLNASFPGAPADVLVEALDLEGIAVASGSACHAGSTEPSHVLLAMGLPARIAESAIRMSLGPRTDAHDIERVLDVLPGVVQRAREAAS